MSQPCTTCSTCAPPRALPRICGRTLPCTLLAPPSSAAPRPPSGPWLASHHMCSPFDPRQRALAFNQPLSFDTSSVTSMESMLRVRCSPCPAPNLQSSPLLHAACPAVARRLSRLPTCTSACTACLPFDPRQFESSAFNQPLSFDTSSVTTLYYMFAVRSSPCPQSAVKPSPAHAACAPRSSAASRLPGLSSSHTVCPPFIPR